MGALSGLLQALPLPLAQLLRRSLNGKSAVERHNNAYYAAEAALKLAAAARIGVWLDRCIEPGGPLARQLEALALPSAGHWAGFLRDVDRALAGRPDCATLPLGDALGKLDRRREDWTRVRALAEAAEEAGVVTDQVRKSALREGFVGFFNLVVAYRNEVMGHGAQRRTAHYERFGELFLGALEEVFGGTELFGGLRLGQVRLRVTDDSASSDVTWQDLTGLAGMPLADPDRGPGPAFDGKRVSAGRLYLFGPGTAVPLHPLAVYREDEFGNEFVGFLNKTVRRTKRQADGPVDEVRRADYLDYATGEILQQESALEALTDLLAASRRGATAEDLRAAAPVDVPGIRPRAGAGGGRLDRRRLRAARRDRPGRHGHRLPGAPAQRQPHRRPQVLPPSLTGDKVVLARFRREIAVLARCDHPNVVRILTSGADGDRIYYAMEYVDGADLVRVSRVLTRWKTTGTALRDGHIPASISSVGASTAEGEKGGAEGEEHAPRAEAAEVPRIEGGRDYFTRLAELFADAAGGLDHIHEQGVIHRDVKPGNLMLTADGRRIVVMDLGLAKVADASQSLTRTETGVLGTLRYAPPEQLRRREAKVDRRSDVYGLGATLYELATGRPIFDGETEERVLKQVLDDQPVPPQRAERTVPRDLATIITVAVDKSPDRRYPTASAMADDFGPRRSATDRRATAGPIHRLGLFARRRPALVAALTTAVVLLSIAPGIWWLLNRPRTERRTFHCAVVAPVRGVPVCVQEVSGATAARRAVTFRMELRNGRLERMDRVNGSGEPAPDAELRGTVSSEYLYRTDGTLQEIVHRDRLDRVVRRDLFSEDVRRQSIVDEDHNPLPLEGSEVSVLLWTFDQAGHAVECRYANTFGSPRPDPNRMYGYRATVDRRGLPSAWDVMGPDGRPRPTPTGVARIDREYDERGNLAVVSYFGADGKPLVHGEGVSVRRTADHEVGNQAEEAFRNAEGGPTTRRPRFRSVVWA